MKAHKLIVLEAETKIAIAYQGGAPKTVFTAPTLAWCTGRLYVL
jgi:hypothetical protein